MANNRRITVSYPTDSGNPNAPRYQLTLCVDNVTYTNGIWETRDGALRLGRDWRSTRTVGARRFVENAPPATMPTSSELAAALDELTANQDQI